LNMDKMFIPGVPDVPVIPDVPDILNDSQVPKIPENPRKPQKPQKMLTKGVPVPKNTVFDKRGLVSGASR